MKQSDIFTIILVASIGMVGAFFLGNAILGNPDEASVKIKMVSPEVTTDLAAPDPELFNKDAINPTVEMNIGECIDANKNGMIDADERRACRGETDEEDGGGAEGGE